MALVGTAQQGCAGERPDVGHPGLAGYGFRHAGGGSAHRADQTEHPVFDQFPRPFHGQFGFVAVVPRLDLEQAAVHAPLAVGLGEGGPHAQAHVVTQSPGLAAQRRRLAEDDRVVKDAVGGKQVPGGVLGIPRGRGGSRLLRKRRVLPGSRGSVIRGEGIPLLRWNGGATGPGQDNQRGQGPRRQAQPVHPILLAVRG